MANTTWNNSDKAANITLSGGNLVATATSGVAGVVRTTDRQISGKYYWEVTSSVSINNGAFGIVHGLTSLTNQLSSVPGSIGGAVVSAAGAVLIDGTSLGGVFSALTVGTIVCIALDLDNQRIWFRLNAGGNWNNSATANPATNTGGYSIPHGHALAAYPAAGFAISGAVQTANFGDTAFSGTVPSGFTAGFPTGTPAEQIILSGIGREALIASVGQANLAGLAREALISGTGVDGRITAKSFARAQLSVTGGVTAVAAGAGGGGAAGLFGTGEFGQIGQWDGTGGFGGAADNYNTARQTIPSTTGNAGHEWNSIIGSGSGGSGGNWGGSGHGGNGGVGGTYGGGGGGGGGGLGGGGLGALGGEGAIFLQYNPGTGPINILLTKDSPTTFTIPLDWSLSNNIVLILGAGGCGQNGGLTTGGAGGGGGSIVGAINTNIYTPGQVITIDIPSAAQVCAGTKGNTVLGVYSAPPGVNGNGSTAGTPPVYIPPENGGIGSGASTGGGGGPGLGGPGGSVVTTLVTGRIDAKSRLSILAGVARAAQYAVPVSVS